MEKCRRSLIIAFCILHFALCIGLTACSVPNLESPECAGARDTARQFYSLAIGGDPISHPDILARWKALRAPNFTAGTVRSDASPYHFSLVDPVSSRVDECSLQPDGKSKVNVTVIWRMDEQNYERNDSVTLVNTNGTWLIERIDVGKQPAMPTPKS